MRVPHRSDVASHRAKSSLYIAVVPALMHFYGNLSLTIGISLVGVSVDNWLNDTVGNDIFGRSIAFLLLVCLNTTVVSLF